VYITALFSNYLLNYICLNIRVSTVPRTKFTYFGQQIRTLTKIFKNTNIAISFTTNNTVKTKCRKTIQDNSYANCGVYELRCNTCNHTYIGQTGRSFHTRFKEHIRDIKHNVEKSKYATHILVENHEYGPIQDVMKVLKVEKKGRHLDIYEKLYIYKAAKNGQIINKQHNEQNNALFDLLVK
jgi:hypothetical protein